MLRTSVVFQWEGEELTVFRTNHKTNVETQSVWMINPNGIFKQHGIEFKKVNPDKVPLYVIDEMLEHIREQNEILLETVEQARKLAF